MQLIINNSSMTQVDPSRLSKVYRSTIARSYLFGFLGFMVGMKVCDLIMYDPKKHEMEVELMEEEFWRINGEPKYLKPEVVQSVTNPNKFRKSWIQVVYGKDSYITKEQAED